jgi:lysophospholipase L1-like esterase
MYKQKAGLLIATLTWLLFFNLGSADAAIPMEISLAGKRVLWLGDSITQAGDYVTFVQYFLDKNYPTDKFDIISIGLASETASGLSEKAHPFPRPDVKERLQRALDLVKPAIVVACYGMNDGIYHPQSADRMKAFQDGINKVIAACKAAHAQVILLTPPPFDKIMAHTLPITAPDFSYMGPYEDYDSVLADYAKWELSLSPRDALAIDLHQPINDYLARQRVTDPHFSFTGEGIHPNPAGHLLMAEVILNGLGLSIHFDADLNAELAKVQQDPLYSLVKTQRENRSNAWLPYVGYTRGAKVKSNSVNQDEKNNADMQIKIDQARKP